MNPERLVKILEAKEVKSSVDIEEDNDTAEDEEYICKVSKVYYEEDDLVCTCSRNAKCSTARYCPCFKVKKFCSPRCHLKGSSKCTNVNQM